MDDMKLVTRRYWVRIRDRLAQCGRHQTLITEKRKKVQPVNNPAPIYSSLHPCLVHQECESNSCFNVLGTTSGATDARSVVARLHIHQFVDFLPHLLLGPNYSFGLDGIQMRKRVREALDGQRAKGGHVPERGLLQVGGKWFIVT